jgi:glucose-induced degradation protein 4
MPTPDDAVVSPVEQHESSIANRTTCPPDDARISTFHDPSNARDSSASNHVDSAQRRPMQQQPPTPPPHGTREQSPAETHIKPPSASIEAPNRDIPTPMTATDDGAEDQRTSLASPLSATAPVAIRFTPSHLAAPFPSRRVRFRIELGIEPARKTLFADQRAVSPELILVTPPPRQPFQGQSDLRPPTI